MYARCVSVLLLLTEVLSQKSAGDSCVEQHTGVLGRCSPPEQCSTAAEDYRSKGVRPTFCEHSSSQVLVCCRDGSSVQQAAGSANVSNGSQLSSDDGRRVSERKCDEYSHSVTRKVEFITLMTNPEHYSIWVTDCKYANLELIVRGDNAYLGEFPHVAAVGWPDSNGSYSFDCGGSLISSRFVLTAGHCWNRRARDTSPAIVRLGDLDLDPSVDDGANPVEVPIKTIHKHPDYKPPKRYNDIALLELATDVDFSRDVRPACLWSRPDFGNHTRATVTSWGATDPASGSGKVLKMFSMSLLENRICDRLLASARNRHWSGFADTQMCAGELRGGKDTCRDHGGSSLHVFDGNKCVYRVMGVGSFGRSCPSNTPDVYTRVSSYLDWIEGVVWPGE